MLEAAAARAEVESAILAILMISVVGVLTVRREEASVIVILRWRDCWRRCASRRGHAGHVAGGQPAQPAERQRRPGKRHPLEDARPPPRILGRHPLRRLRKIRRRWSRIGLLPGW